MSQKRKTLILGGASLVIAVCVTSALVISRASTQPSLIAKGGLVQSRTIPPRGSLRLQPEAAAVNRRLGDRFKVSGRAESTLSGTLTLSSNQQQVTIIRRQIESGELVEVLLADRRFTWSHAEGIKATPGTATQPEQLLVERLIFDSPDQFVLAQLRGASYFTVTRNVRPDDAGENYSGPLWRLVRVSEPQGTSEMTEKTRWRLYYVNEVTNLIDRVVSENDGQTIEASIQWTDRQGEQVPSHIKWTMGGQTIMEFETAAFSLTK
jgi:hypothetical protein